MHLKHLVKPLVHSLILGSIDTNYNQILIWWVSRPSVCLSKPYFFQTCGGVRLHSISSTQVCNALKLWKNHVYTHLKRTGAFITQLIYFFIILLYLKYFYSLFMWVYFINTGVATKYLLTSYNFNTDNIKAITNVSYEIARETLIVKKPKPLILLHYRSMAHLAMNRWSDQMKQNGTNSSGNRAQPIKRDCLSKMKMGKYIFVCSAARYSMFFFWFLCNPSGAALTCNKLLTFEWQERILNCCKLKQISRKIQRLKFNSLVFSNYFFIALK